MRTYNLQRLFCAIPCYSEGESAPAAEPPVTESPEAVLPGGTETSPLGGNDSVSGDSGADTLSGESTTEGNDTVAGPETSTGDDAVEIEVNLPDSITVNEDALGAFKAFAVEHKLSNEAAQALVDQYVGLATAQAEQYATAQTNAWKTTIDGWRADLAKDPQFTGENAVKAQTTIGKALDQYGSPEARAAFDLTGAGHHPAIVKMIHSMAKALEEGVVIPGGGPGRGPRTPGEVLYPPKEQ